MLKAVPVLVLHGGHHHLLALKVAALQFDESVGRRVPPFRQEHHERQGLRGVGQEALEMVDHRLHQFLAVGRIRLERAAHGPEVQERAPRSEVGIRVGERGTVLSEVAVQGRREALERHPEGTLEAFENRDWQCHLRGLALVDAQIRLIALQRGPNAGQKHFELLVVEAIVSVQMF